MRRKYHSRQQKWDNYGRKQPSQNNYQFLQQLNMFNNKTEENIKDIAPKEMIKTFTKEVIKKQQNA